MHRGADIVNNAHNSRRVFALDQFADDLVVEIVDLRPLDSFSYVLFLHRNHQATLQLDTFAFSILLTPRSS